MGFKAFFSPQENKISRTFFIDYIDKHSKVSNAHNSDDCHGVFNGGKAKQRLKFFMIALRLLGFDAFFPLVILICAKFLGCQTKENNIIIWPMPLGARPRSIKNVSKIYGIVRKFMCTLDILDEGSKFQYSMFISFPQFIYIVHTMKYIFLNYLA